jgi:IclR family transcriptional regulator, acetate operon repressor
MDVKTAARTLDLFEAFANDPRPLRLSELAAVLQAPVSSCHQLLRTLENRGYLYGLQLKSYYPTRKMLENAQHISSHDPLLKLVAPYMEELRDATGESVLVAQLTGHQALILAVLESGQAIRYSARAGALRNLYCSGIGKCLLGELNPAERSEHLPRAPYPRLTATTLTTRGKLDEDLEHSRKRGWYASHGETSTDLWSIAAPVRAGGTVLALSVAGPATRLESSESRHVKSLQALAGKLNSSLQTSA